MTLDKQQSDDVIPISAQFGFELPVTGIWRVLLPSTKGGQGHEIRAETALERDAWRVFRNLRREGHAAIVARWELFRVRIAKLSAVNLERFAFVEAYGPQDACTRVASACAAVEGCSVAQAFVRLSPRSYQQCFYTGVSPDAQLRIFEVDWQDGAVITWVTEPIFLLQKPSVWTRKWLQIPIQDGGGGWRPPTGSLQ